ncbi:hypothetical protein D3C73_868780 [compost metagenome]
MAQATVNTTVKIDVGPDGIRFTLEGLDADLCNLIQKAMNYEVITNEYRTFDTNDLILRSVKEIGFVDRPIPPDPVGPPDPTQP